MGLKIGQMMHLIYINKLHQKFPKQIGIYNISMHYKRYLFYKTRFIIYAILAKYHLYSQKYKYFYIFVMCLFHTTRLLFYIFIFQYLKLSYMVFYTKNYEGLYFWNTQAN
jgi:hypothetical protein